MIQWVLIKRDEISEDIFNKVRQTSIDDAQVSADGFVALSFDDKKGVPNELVGRTLYTTAEIKLEVVTEGEI